MLQALAWVNGEGSIGQMAKAMLSKAESQILATLNIYLQDQGAMMAPQACGPECGLPEGVTLSYRVPMAPDFVEACFVELQIDVQICVKLTGKACDPPAEEVSGSCCYPPYEPVALPSIGPVSSTTTDRPYVTPRGGTMLAGLRVSSTL